jgi:hypothetical protein
MLLLRCFMDPIVAHHMGLSIDGADLRSVVLSGLRVPIYSGIFRPAFRARSRTASTTTCSARGSKKPAAPE